MTHLRRAVLCHAACAASLTKLAKEAGEASKDTTFSQYAAAVLNSLVYLLKDSLERLQDIHNIEASMADKAAWKALPPRSVPDSFEVFCHCVMCCTAWDSSAAKVGFSFCGGGLSLCQVPPLDGLCLVKLRILCRTAR